MDHSPAVTPACSDRASSCAVNRRRSRRRRPGDNYSTASSLRSTRCANSSRLRASATGTPARGRAADHRATRRSGAACTCTNGGARPRHARDDRPGRSGGVRRDRRPSRSRRSAQRSAGRPPRAGGVDHQGVGHRLTSAAHPTPSRSADPYAGWTAPLPRAQSVPGRRRAPGPAFRR